MSENVVRGGILEAYLERSKSPKFYWLSTEDKDRYSNKSDFIENYYCALGILEVNVVSQTNLPEIPITRVHIKGCKKLYPVLMKNIDVLNSWLEGPKENYVLSQNSDLTWEPKNNRFWGWSGGWGGISCRLGLPNGSRSETVYLRTDLSTKNYDSDLKFLAALGREIDDLIAYQEKFLNLGLLRETFHPNKVSPSSDLR